MSAFSTRLFRIATVALAGCVLALAGCHSVTVKEKAAMKEAQGKFDVTLKAGKGGQFLVNGALLSALDTGSHFAYLKETGKLPRTVLLLPSDDSKVRKEHLQYMARMELDYNFVAYYDDDGTLTKIDPVQTKARALQDYHAPAKESQESSSKDASGGYTPSSRDGR